MKTVSIVIPVYFNEDSIPALFDELAGLERALEQRRVGLEVICVDDGSRDNSFAALCEARNKISRTKLIRLAKNFGAVSASKCGFRYVTGDCFMSLAADLQDPPELIVEMVDRWLAGSKFVVCVREAREDSAASRFLAGLYYRLIRVLVVRDYPSGGYDLGLMDKALLPYMQKSAKNINNALFAYWLGFTPSVISYTRRARQHGKSRWTFSKRVKFFLDSLLGFSMTPIRLISSIGLIIAAMSFIYGLVIIRGAIVGEVPVPGFATLATLVAFLSGLIIVMLGIIGEYIWRIFDEINGRPEAVVEEVR